MKLEDDDPEKAQEEAPQSAEISRPGHAEESDAEEDTVAPTSDVVEAAEAEPAEQDANEGTQLVGPEIADERKEQPEETHAAAEPEAGHDKEGATEMPQGDGQRKMESASLDPAPKDSTVIGPEYDQEDPIEPSEGFEKQSDIELEDPIELDEADAPERAATPPMSPLKPGRAKRMKDRYGNLPASGAPSASQPVRRSSRAASRQPEALGQRAETAPPAPIPEEESLQTDDAPVRRSSRKAPQEPTTQPTSPTPPLAPAPAPEPPVAKRRGRPPTKTAEEKAKIATEKEAEKKRKAEEREAEKQRKAIEKKAAAEEKARLKAEKAAAAKAKKAGAPRKSLGKAAGSVEAAVQPLSTQTTRPQDTASAAMKTQAANAEVPLSSPGVSTAKWTALSQASSFPEADTSMVDELRSSSEVGDDSNLNPREEEAVGGDEDETRDMEDDTPTVKVPSRSQPLFTPSDSQNLNATPHHSSQPMPGSSQSQSQSPSKFKRPLAFKPQFRRLSDIASQELFSPRSPVSSVPLPSQRRQSTATADDRRTSMYGDLANIASDSSSDSGSDEETLSHIPKHRRAGLQKKEMFVE